MHEDQENPFAVAAQAFAEGHVGAENDIELGTRFPDQLSEAGQSFIQKERLRRLAAEQ